MGCGPSSEDRTVYPSDRKKTSFKKDVNVSANRTANVTPMTKTTQQKSYVLACPLTERQRFSIAKSWKGIARNMEQTGILMFLRLFETNEEVRSMFTKLVHDGEYDIAQLRESKELENHVKQVMFTLDEAISSLEDIDIVIKLLRDVGRRHRKLTKKGFSPHVFFTIEEPFLMAVKDTLGDRYTANMENIYRTTIHFILETLKDGYNND